MVLEAAEAVEANLEHSNVEGTRYRTKESPRFLFHLRQKCVLGRDFALLCFYYSPRFARCSKANPREQSPALGNT